MSRCMAACRSEAMEDTVALLRSTGCPEALGLPADLTVESDVNEAIDRLERDWEGLEVLVNAAVRSTWVSGLSR